VLVVLTMNIGGDHEHWDLIPCALLPQALWSHKAASRPVCESNEQHLQVHPQRTATA
jgi:hypothetical protein